MLTSIQAGVLDVAYQVQGPDGGAPVLLLHGFPYDIHAYTEVADELAAAGFRVYVPFLRGYGATRYLSADTPRSGQQAALAHDVLALLDALGLERATLAGYDWGGRASGIVAALWPERVAGLVLGDGYPIQDIAAAATQPAEPAAELRYWYQYYFHGERGAPAWRNIAATSVDCSGRCGHPAGAAATPPMRLAPRPSTIPISSTP